MCYEHRGCWNQSFPFVVFKGKNCPFIHICRTLPSISKTACGSSAKGKLHCETEQCQITSFILSHLMRAIACTHASTHTTGLIRLESNMHHFCLWHWLSGALDKENEKKNKNMHVKNNPHHFCLLHLLPGTLEWRKWKKKKNIRLNSWYFSLNAVWLHIQVVWETRIPLCARELWCPKNTLKFFIFRWYSTEVVINDFTMHLIIWKWLGRQNCWKNRKKWDKKTSEWKKNLSASVLIH